MSTSLSRPQSIEPSFQDLKLGFEEGEEEEERRRRLLEALFCFSLLLLLRCLVESDR
jgi:hypothetical protein